MLNGEVLNQSDAEFKTTQWTIINGLCSEDEHVQRVAAEQVVEIYWPPVYACARRLVHSREEAEDLCQGFFADVVLGRHLFERADESRGRLRWLIRTALKHYATDQWRRSKAHGGGRNLSLGDLDREEGLGVDGDSEDAFDRRWALILFEEAIRRCEACFQDSGKVRYWRLFETRVLHPAVHNTTVNALAIDSAACGFHSCAEAASAVQRVKRRFDAIFREVVAETLSDAESVESEYRLVRSLLQH